MNGHGRLSWSKQTPASSLEPRGFQRRRGRRPVLAIGPAAQFGEAVGHGRVVVQTARMDHPVSHLAYACLVLREVAWRRLFIGLSHTLHSPLNARSCCANVTLDRTQVVSAKRRIVIRGIKDLACSPSLERTVESRECCLGDSPARSQPRRRPARYPVQAEG